ncbi:MAG: hypothetical protein PCFJNLEI_03450 [Verrucomicrobiae bacterium]|nr:hypothetical protein [Verrucomicrobiae bacterium]
MDTFKFGVKLFFTNSPKPLKDYIPVFHGWIQRQALPGHMLLDVHDYSHVHHGPGILLVSHEANISVDEAEGRRGLVYIRKQPATLNATITAATAAAKLLGEPFDAGQFEVFVNDRLVKVGNEQIVAATGGTVSAKPGDPRERQTFVVHRA